MKKLIATLAIFASATAFACTEYIVEYQANIKDAQMQRTLQIGSIQGNYADVKLHISSPFASDDFTVEGKGFFAKQFFGYVEQDGCRINIRLQNEKANVGYTTAEVTGEEGCSVPAHLQLNGTYNLKE